MKAKQGTKKSKEKNATSQTDSSTMESTSGRYIDRSIDPIYTSHFLHLQLVRRMFYNGKGFDDTIGEFWIDFHDALDLLRVTFGL